MENTETGHQEQPLPINPTIAAELEDLTSDAEEAKTEQQRQREADTSPVGLWKAAIREIAPMAAMIDEELAPRIYEDKNGNKVDEVEVLANGLAPALAKHFPDMKGFSLPVEFVAVYTVFMVFGPKVKTIRARNAAEQVKEVKGDESEST